MPCHILPLQWAASCPAARSASSPPPVVRWGSDGHGLAGRTICQSVTHALSESLMTPCHSDALTRRHPLTRPLTHRNAVGREVGQRWQRVVADSHRCLCSQFLEPHLHGWQSHVHSVGQPQSHRRRQLARQEDRKFEMKSVMSNAEDLLRATKACKQEMGGNDETAGSRPKSVIPTLACVTFIS